jgi:hypothetical protein
MRKTLALAVFTSAFSAVALAADWTGALLDSACHDRQQPSQQQQQPAQQQSQQKSDSACMATSQTTAFALNVAGKVYKFDAAGNTKAMAALKNRADRTAPGKQTQPANITAKVAGTESGGTITVDTIQVQ